jgi:hypothetical protein
VIAIVGAFNNWVPVNMKKDGDEFEISYWLVRGFHYRYAFIDMKMNPNRAFTGSDLTTAITRSTPYDDLIKTHVKELPGLEN